MNCRALSLAISLLLITALSGGGVSYAGDAVQAPAVAETAPTKAPTVAVHKTPARAPARKKMSAHHSSAAAKPKGKKSKTKANSKKKRPKKKKTSKSKSKSKHSKRKSKRKQRKSVSKRRRAPAKPRPRPIKQAAASPPKKPYSAPQAVAPDRPHLVDIKEHTKEVHLDFENADPSN